MASKNDTEVIIGGKVLRLSGYESEEYLQKVAAYINGKISEYNRVESFHKASSETQNMLLQLNIADDYFKAKKQISLLEDEIQSKEKELYEQYQNEKDEEKKANLRLAYLCNLEKNLSIPEDFRMEVKDKAQEYKKAENFALESMESTMLEYAVNEEDKSCIKNAVGDLKLK